MDAIIVTALINSILIIGCMVIVITAKHRSLSVKILSLLVLASAIIEMGFGVYIRNRILGSDNFYSWVWTIMVLVNFVKVILLLILGSVLSYKRITIIRTGKNPGQIIKMNE